ncbi:MAG: EAL domain-containing protein [Cyanobacteria bacterium J06632_3]
MTYSPSIETTQYKALTTPPDGSLDEIVSTVEHALLGQVGCLLQCPIDTPQLWSQLLSTVGTALSCTSAQLLWSWPSLSPDAHYWRDANNASESTDPSSNHSESKDAGCENTCCENTGAQETWTRLWEYLDLPSTLPTEPLWFSQASELQAQLADLADGGKFQLHGTRLYAAGCWPTEMSQLLGWCDNQHLLLLPLCHEQDCVGVLALARAATVEVWLSEEVAQVEAVGSQIYLAIQRSHIDRIFRTRSSRDQLTQLPDRMLFTQQLTREITRAIEKDVMLGVAFLDLDRFKNINDTLGHEAGDSLLKQVAERLQGCLRGYDVVARWGGDEFTLLLCELRSAEEISHIADRILQRLSAPFRVQSEELFVTASLGIALAPYDGQDEQTLLRNADAAMYQAKARGRNNYQVYFEEINADARTQLNLETDLRKAIDNGELFLCYQPQVDLQTAQWIGMEALIRWRHPILGLIPPSKFIPIAEETGLIEPIGQWVLKAACAQYGEWQQQGFPPLRLAVNLSAQQFHRTSLVRSVIETLKASNFDPQLLELEVTESAAMHDVTFAISVLKKLSHAGIQIAMDDFGTGYSSLSVLKHFPLDTIKIDRSFVQDLVDSPSDAAIASTIIALAKGLDFKVLAEGIETAAQRDVLNHMGCDYAQGYWFSRPLTTQQISQLLDSGTFCQTANLPDTIAH